MVEGLIRTLKLPIPIPPHLERSQAPWSEHPLQGESILLGAAAGSFWTDTVLSMLQATGAQVQRSAEEIDSHAALRALIFDAGGIKEPNELRALYDFFHPRLRRLLPCGRILILGIPPALATAPAIAATAQALEGFCRSLAREMGYRGITVQLLRVEPGAESRLEGPLRFLLSRHSAYVDGQVLSIGAQTRSTAVISWTRPLDGKTALVTGAAQGIGAAIARTLAREGARVIGLDRPGTEAALTELSQTGGGSLTLDLGDEQTPDRLVAALREHYGGIDIIVHNAGITRDRTLARMAPVEWDSVLTVNLAAVPRIDRALLQGILQDAGRIVCVSSINGIAGHRGQTNYAASKAGLIGYVTALSRELAAHGITVNAVAPGFIETAMTATMPWLGRLFARRLNSLSQGGLPEDVAEAVTWLASPGAVGVSGAVLRVCGQSLVGA